MNDERRNGQYPQYPQSGQPYPQYPQSGQPYPQYPQSGQPYPQSGQPYPQYPQSGQYPPQYQQPGQPYPQPGGGKKRGPNLWVILGIVVGLAVLIGAIFYQLIDLSKKEAEIRNDTLYSYDEYKSYENKDLGLVVDGSEESLPQTLLTMSGHSYISLEDFSKVFGYDFVIDAKNKKTTVKSNDRTAVFVHESTDAFINTGSEDWRVDLVDKAIMFDNEQTYVPIRSLAEVFGFKSVEWDESTNKVVVVTTGK